MEPFEQKLKEYFDQAQPSEEFIEKLKSLPDTPAAKPAQRRPRRWVTPVAAAIAAAVALGSGWAYLGSMLPVPPEPTVAAPAPDSGSRDDGSPASPPPADNAPGAPAQAPKPPAQAKPGASAPQTPEQSTAPEAPAAQTTPAPDAPAPHAAPTPDAPAAQTPQASEPPALQTPEQSTAPELPVAPSDTEPGPAAPDEPRTPEAPESVESDEPTEEVDPPEAQTPPLLPEDVQPSVEAKYASDGTQETVTLTNLANGEAITIDVTGILPKRHSDRPAGAGLEAAAAASEAPMGLYFGTADAFGWQIDYVITGYKEGADVYVSDMRKSE